MLQRELTATVETALALGLTAEEYERIVQLLGREPNPTELGMFAVMWSEHCSYKNSLKLLRTLPRTGGRVLSGNENAGMVDIGGGYAIAFKIESHNHPSAVEPYQGAATGVGGILRDIFTTGARPIAVLDSLRFGELKDARTRYLVCGVVRGIGDYGNAFGVPTVGGEVYFQPCYADNPLVNAMAVGIVPIDRIIPSVARGVGNPVYLIGNRTGRDGIHGASLLASRTFEDGQQDMRPSVQVGDPFAEKLLLEAVLELRDAGIVVGMQDMGAAGICCSTSEMSARGRVGMRIDLDAVPLRDPGMSAYEILLSESQERMLVVLRRGTESIAEGICRKWGIGCARIGEVTEDGILRYYRHGELVAEVPAWTLVAGEGAPQYDREAREPAYLQELRAVKPEDLPEPVPPEEAFWRLLTSPTIASKRWVFEQYDHQVQTNTVLLPGMADAAVLRLRELPGRGIAASVDCNSRYVYLNPYRGAQIAVAEAARNVACVGAEPVAITNCLNFGDPYDPEVFWQFREAVRGMGDACRTFGTPVTGGNVSFYNASPRSVVYPTPVIGMLGLVEDVTAVVGMGFRAEGDVVLLIGPQRAELGGSEYLWLFHGMVAGDAPTLELEEERRLQQLLLTAIRRRWLRSAHDCSEGGLAICLAEKAIASEGALGAELVLPWELTAAQLFGEAQTRVVVSVPPEHVADVVQLCREWGLPCVELGWVVRDRFVLQGVVETTVTELRHRYEQALPELVERI
ncbi:MAG: phosphoribosylformylglycinamidine synthase subunit PurL [Candidatus Kapabacteria bacterium]|nr:phosphoribosylformylglycinamidine synthase subunit PurL [Candidatus Kapabacteria bacterium]MDW8012574.1 phosphoribosylformylglycinamidine synthase subunit PurL [Bacteroidota bacterium]